MSNILLTGAGFSRNWGGWLINEAFEYLLGSNIVDDILRTKLWAAREHGGGFEDALAQLQANRSAGSYERALTEAIKKMFSEMALGYAAVAFEPQSDPNRMVKTFLARFDSIYTLNQDTLIEQSYGRGRCSERFSGCVSPGIKATNQMLQIGSSEFAMSEPAADFSIPENYQPYIKLHGSFNWMNEEGSMLILGGNKAANIAKSPLLSWYYQMFWAALSERDTRLMIIGYSFNDSHINKAILNACDTSDLRVFIIDPNGVDAMKRYPGTKNETFDIYNNLKSRVIGASRRPMTSIFGNDAIEFNKVMQFFR